MSSLKYDTVCNMKYINWYLPIAILRIRVWSFMTPGYTPKPTGIDKMPKYPGLRVGICLDPLWQGCSFDLIPMLAKVHKQMYTNTLLANSQSKTHRRLLSMKKKSTKQIHNKLGICRPMGIWCAVIFDDRVMSAQGPDRVPNIYGAPALHNTLRVCPTENVKDA